MFLQVRRGQVHRSRRFLGGRRDAHPVNMQQLSMMHGQNC